MARIRWGILGTASIAETVAPAIASSRHNQVCAVASRDLSRARSWADGIGIRDAYGSYEEMLSAGGFDVVYNPLPNSLHAPWTIRALEAGYPVLCEKPFARAVTTGSPPRWPVEDAVANMAVIDALCESARRGELLHGPNRSEE